MILPNMYRMIIEALSLRQEKLEFLVEIKFINLKLEVSL